MGYVARLHFVVSRNRIAAPVLTPDLGDTAPHAQKDFAARKFFFFFPSFLSPDDCRGFPNLKRGVSQ